MKTSRLVIVGAGGFGREVISWATHSLQAGASPPLRGYLLDAGFPGLDASYGLSRLGGLDDFEPEVGDACIVAVAEPASKRQMVGRLRARGVTFASLIHPTAVLAKTAVLGEGCVVCPFAIVSADAVVGEFVTINSMSSLGHDSRVGNYSTLSAHIDITGGVRVGEDVFIGSGARLLPGITVGNAAKVGAGAVVVRSIKDGTTVYAIPAKRLC